MADESQECPRCGARFQATTADELCASCARNEQTVSEKPVRERRITKPLPVVASPVDAEAGIYCSCSEHVAASACFVEKE
jgi:hypothetical protein